MTTSPSWFDQEKFSRLVKKVGSKNVPAASAPVAIPKIVSIPAKSAPGSIPAIKTPPVVTTAKTEPLPSPKRSTMIKSAPLPAITPVFAYEKPEPPPQEPSSSVADTQVPAPVESPARQNSEELGTLREEWATLQNRFQSLNEELFQTNQNLEQMRGENTGLREQLRQAENAASDRETSATQIRELSSAAQERDQARSEITILREQLRQAEEAGRDREALVVQIDELSPAVQERDQARKEYAKLREQFETLKQENARMGEKRLHSEESESASHEQAEQMTRRLAEREQEVAEFKVKTVGLEDVIETLKQELNTLQEQVHQARDEATAAQSGLILSQKALQETRDALREASVGASMTKANLENLKNECSTLVQQNMLLQAQHDQTSRELSAAKSKLSARG
jgi:chromosome segregation ATPase